MRKDSGFSLMELMIAIAILGILAAIAIPGYIGWLPNYRLRGAAMDVLSAMRNAKSSAIRRNADAVVIFSLVNDTYVAFLDNVPVGGNWALDAGETIISRGTMPAGIDMFNSTFPANTFGFNSRGLQKAPLGATYDVHLRNNTGGFMGVRVNIAGTTRIIRSTDGITWN